MCFRIPGRIVEISGPQDMRARVDVEGSDREVSLSMVAEDGPVVGDWVLIHMGVAVEVIDPDRAAEVQEGLQLLGRAQERGLADLEDSWWKRQGRDHADPADAPPKQPDHDEEPDDDAAEAPDDHPRDQVTDEGSTP